MPGATTHLIILMHIAATCMCVCVWIILCSRRENYRRRTSCLLWQERERGGLAPLSDYFQLLGRLFYRPSSPAVILWLDTFVPLCPHSAPTRSSTSQPLFILGMDCLLFIARTHISCIGPNVLSFPHSQLLLLAKIFLWNWKADTLGRSARIFIKARFVCALVFFQRLSSV